MNRHWREDAVPFPFKADDIAASIAAVLRVQGEVLALSVLASSTARVEWASWEAWDDSDLYLVVLAVDPVVFASLSEEQRNDAWRPLNAAVQDLLRGHVHVRGRVVLSAGVLPDDTWRARAVKWLTGEGVTNQGRVRSDNIASRECDGLLFRSQAEIDLYRELKRRGVAFAPLPVFLRGGQTYQRLEPDFVVIKDGVMLVVEVDGDTIHTEPPADAHRRLAVLTDEGVQVERVKASEISDDVKAVADRIEQVIEKVVRRR